MRSRTHHPAQDLRALGEPALGRASLPCAHTAVPVRHGGRTTQGESTDGQCPFRSGGRRPLPLRRGPQRPQAPSPPGAAATSPQGHAAGVSAEGPGTREVLLLPVSVSRDGLPGPGRPRCRHRPVGPHRRGDTLRGNPGSPARLPARQPPLRVPAPGALTELVLGGRGHVAGWGGKGGGVRRSAPPTPLRHRYRAGGRLSPPPSPPLPPPPPPPRPAPCGSTRQWQRPLFCHRQYIFRESRRPNRPPPSRTRPGPAATAPPDGP